MSHRLPSTRALGRSGWWVLGACLAGACLNPQPDEWPTNHPSQVEQGEPPGSLPASGGTETNGNGMVEDGVSIGAGGGAGAAPSDSGSAGTAGAASLPPTDGAADAGVGDAGGALSDEP